MDLSKIKRFASKNKISQCMINVFFLIYGGIMAVVCLCLRIFPIQEEKIVCSNMKGARYGDNPKYITDCILKNSNRYDIVWILQDSITENLPDSIRRVRPNTLSMLYELVTARFWIDSNAKQFGILKRKRQIYIQTWHGSYGLKKIGKDIIDKISFVDKVNTFYNSAIADLYVSNSRMTSEIYRRAFEYHGDILECGSPRNDIFYEKTAPYVEKVWQHFNIVGKKIVLYAPTFRANFSTEAFRLDYDMLRDSLENRFGGEWIVLVRLHPQNIMDADHFLEYDNNVINATHYSIMQELLVACDVLVTDYSSCMFDFATKGKPCFLYATDVDKYKQERDYYFELEELPFPLAQNNKQLKRAVLEFDEQQYSEKLQKLFDEVGLCESGEASKRVVDYIEQMRREH